MNRTRYRLVLGGFLAVAAFFLLAEHRAHVFVFLPYVLLLACPLMHLFMHHGHRRDHQRPDQARRPDGQGDA